MDNLSNTIYSGYVKRFAELPFDKQFHFASRLYLWSGDPWAWEQLERLRPWFTANENPAKVLGSVIADAHKDPTVKIGNAVERRKPFFDKYPLLQPCNAALFRLLFFKTIYDIDARGLFFTFFNQQELEQLRSDLAADTAAVAALSTYAINFFYLYETFFQHDDALPEPKDFLAVGQASYDKTNPEEIQLLIYLYAHTIIGESLFYSRPVPETRGAPYKTMLEELEAVLSDNFKNVHLDNKFEFLVCCKLLGFVSRHEQTIFDEAAASISDQGDFLIDRHNDFPQLHKTDLATSEHRNVLFLMASNEYAPSR